MIQVQRLLLMKHSPDSPISSDHFHQTGGLMWVQQRDAGGTYRNVIALSQMTSMMHDADRNRKYHAAIKSVHNKFNQGSYYSERRSKSTRARRATHHWCSTLVCTSLTYHTLIHPTRHRYWVVSHDGGTCRR